MSVYQLYGTSAATADDVASIDVQFDGEIVAWANELWSIDAEADGDYGRVEVSFLSSSCFASNDARGVISATGFAKGMTSSGASLTGWCNTLSGLRIPVTAGERIHLHINLVGLTLSARCILYVLDSTDPRLRRRR